MAMKYLKIFYDFNEGTASLSDAEKGRLITALVDYASTGKTAMLSGGERYLFPLFKAQIDRDIAEYKEGYEKHRDAGRKGGLAKAANSSYAKQTLAKPSYAKQTLAKPSKEEDKDKDNTPPISPRWDERFDVFWAAYPRKAGKDKAREAFKRRKPSDDMLRDMLKAIAAQKQSDQWQRDGGQYIPHPATWLNQGRWQDETPETEQSGHVRRMMFDGG